MTCIHAVLLDDDVLTRRVVACALKFVGGPAVHVTGLAVGQADALEARLARLGSPPDAFILNLDLDTSGLHVVHYLTKAHPGVPVVVLAPRTHDGASVALRAFDAGAAEVVTMPEHPTHVLFAQRHLRKRLMPAMRAVVFGGIYRTERQAPAPRPTVEVDAPRPARLVVAGACTGGAQALKAWLGHLPGPLSAPLLVVQHMPKVYTKALAGWLRAHTGLDVREAPYDAELEPGVVWLAAGGRHLEVRCEAARCRLYTHRGPREHGCRPSIDVLFRSAARAFGPDVLGVVLSGAGDDGVAGAQALREAGAPVLVQDAASADVWELPGAVAEAGLASGVLAPAALAEEVALRMGPPLRVADAAPGERPAVPRQTPRRQGESTAAPSGPAA